MAAHVEDKQQSRNQHANSISTALTLAARPVRSLLPHLLPLIACLLCVPLLLTMSGAAGWLVWNRIPVGWNEEVYLQYGDSTNPYAEVHLPHILYNQPYDISLYLLLPATESNYALGNFMTSLRLSNPRNETLAAVRRPAVLIPHGRSLIKNLMMSPSSVAKIHIPLLSGWVAGTTDVKAYIELGRSDVWRSLGNGQARELTVVQATLNGIVKPTGIGRYPRLTTFVSSFVFFFVSIIVVTGVIFSALGRPVSQRRATSPSGKEDDSDVDNKHDDMDSINEESWDDKSKVLGHGEPQDGSQNGLHSGNIRRRALNLRASEDFSQGTLKPISHVKIETTNIAHTWQDMEPHMHSTSSTVYPKSPYPDVQEDVVSSSSDLQASSFKSLNP